MTETHFSYWLMGVFELNRVQFLSKNQNILINQHLDLVENKGEFSYWLKGFFAAKKSDLNKEDIKLIVDKLKEQFQVKIDPMYPKQIQEQLYALHGPSELDY